MLKVKSHWCGDNVLINNLRVYGLLDTGDDHVIIFTHILIIISFESAHNKQKMSKKFESSSYEQGSETNYPAWSKTSHETRPKIG